MEPTPENREAIIELLDDLIAKRLLQKAGAEISAADSAPEAQENQPSRAVLPLERGATEILQADFAKVEKNLVSLGFFTPSSKRIKDAKTKTITINITVNGNRVEAKATIVPAALYGLPITADQDKYLALQKLITDLRQRQGGQIANPISFTSADLLHLLNHADAGKNYREIDEWLSVMSSTTIISEGAVYLAGKKRWVKDRFHVFDRAVSFGKEIEPGVIADRNYIWFSEWQLENINNNYLLPVDLETYRRLRNHIAKTLVPLLQVWLYASRNEGNFEKRYDELCELLSVRQYHYLSRVKEQFGPSLDELQRHGYLAAWSVEQTSDGKEYKLIFRHGEKFHRDRRRRLAARGSGQPVLPKVGVSERLTLPSETESWTTAPRRHSQIHPQVDAELLSELTGRGVGESGARRLLAKLPPDRPVRALLEWGDHEIARQTGKIRNPAGFYIRLLEGHSSPPPTFESSGKETARHEANLARRREMEESRATVEAEESRRRQRAERRLAALTPDERQALTERFKAEVVAERALVGSDGLSAKIYGSLIRLRLIRYLADQPMDLLVLDLPAPILAMLGQRTAQVLLENTSRTVDSPVDSGIYH